MEIPLEDILEVGKLIDELIEEMEQEETCAEHSINMSDEEPISVIVMAQAQGVTSAPVVQQPKCDLHPPLLPCKLLSPQRPTWAACQV